MAKKRRTGLDALKEYEAGSGYAASSATSYGQTQTQGKTTTFKRSGLDALREYEQYKNPGAVQDTAFDPNYRSRNYQTPGQNAAFEAYKNAVNATQKTRNGVAVSGKVSEQEYSRSPGMQKQYGTYQNYLRGVEAAQGLKLGTLALQGQSALLAGRFAPATQQVREDVDAQNRRAKAAQTAQRDQVRGMRRTSQELGKQIEALEIEQADTHFSGTGLSENGKSVTQLQNEIENLQAQKTAVDNQSVLARAQEAIGNLSKEDQNLLRQYRGQELNGYQVRAYAKYDAKTALNEKGYSDDTLKRLAEWQKVLDDYDNAQKLDQAAQEMGSGSFAGKAAATLFSAALAPGKALGNVESLRGVLPKWAGGYQNEDMPTNIYSPAYNASRLSSGIRQSVMQNMNPTGQFLYQAGTSALDSAVNMAVSTGLVGTFGGVAGAGAKDAVAETMNWVMGSQVAADSVYEGIQNGKSNADALVDGIVEGAIEGFTEKYSVGDIIENMLSGKAVWRKALRSFASEGAEEIASNWLNRAYDVVAKHDRGEVMTAYANYIAEGRTPAQALAAMVGDFAKEDSLSFLAGGLSGLAMSGTYAGVNRVILEANVTQTARAVIEAGEVQDVIDYGMAQEEGTKAHQLAEELQQTVDDGGEVTQKAVENTLREVAKEQQAAVDEGQEPRVPETLTRLEQLQEQARQEQAQTEADEKTFQIYKSAAETAQENQRLAQQYQQEQEQNRAQQSVQAVQQAQQAAQRQYDQDSLFAPIPGTENMGELDPVQYAQRQTADAEQALDEAALQQEKQYLQTQAQRAGYDEQTAAYFLNGNTTGMPAEQYAQSFGLVYEQGRLGASEQRAMRYAEGMNQDVAAAAYRAGLAAGQKGVNNGSIEVTDEGQVGQAGQRAEGQAGGVRQSTAQQQRADTGRKRAQGARDLAKTWDEVTLSELGFGKDNTQKVRVMPKGQEARSEDIQAAEKFFRSMGVQNARFFTGQLTQEIDGQTFYADAAVTEDGSVLIRADSEEYSAFELAKHEGYHLLAKRWPEMAAKIQKRLLSEGKITKEMIESYVDAYAGIYGDDTDAYVEEIVADTYAGMNRTDYGTNQLRADVKMEVGQWQKKTGSARAPPVKMSIAQDFKSRVAAWYKSGMPEGTSFVLGETGATLQGLGAIESDIYMNGEKISTILKEHSEMTIREIQRIPEILDDPVLILKSKNNARSQYGNSRLVMFGAIKAQDGRNIMCVLDLRPTENGLLIDDMQKVSSAYSKDVAPENFIKRSFILFADEKRTIPLLRGMGFKMPMSLLRSGSIGSISYEGKSVNLRGEKFSDVVSVGTTAETAKRKFSASARQASERDKQNLETVSAMLDDGSGRGVFKDAVFLRNPRLMQKLIDEREKTQTAAFRDWFADSKATNTTGEPLLVFHGAGAKFTKFDVGGKPIWLTANIKYAEEYSTATRSVERILPEASIYAGNVDRIIPAYIRVENPADIGNTDGGYSGNYVDLAKRLQIRPSELQAVWEQAGKPELMWQVINTPGMVEMLKRHGYDGVQAVENGVKAWAVFDSAQVKSAVANNGSFSLTNPDIRYSSQDGRYRDLMGEKAAQYVRRLESGLVNELAENLSVPGQAKREVLRPMAEEALRSFFTDGQLDRAKLNDLFETAYQAGIEEDTQYIEQYGDLKKFIRDQKLSISEKDRQDIADYNLFRKAAMGTLTISKDGLPVDVAYQQLREMAPELFPADITAPSDQLMQIYDVARGIQKVQKTLDEYYGPQAASFKKWQQANFTESIDRLTSGLRVAQRYLEAQNKAKEKLAIPQTAEETKQMWAQLKDARRVVEKAQSKTLLTEADQKIVNRLLRGETSPDYVAGLENGQQILKVYEAKADYDMLALKLKAWNAQRKQGLRDFAEQALTEAEAVKWADKTMGIRYQRETMERNIRDIARKGKVSDEKANEFINKYFWPVHGNESKRKNYLVQQQNRIRALGLDRQVRKGNLVSESYAVQWLGEAEFNRDYLKQHPRVERRGGMTFDEWNAAIQEFEKQNPNLDLGKVRAAVKVFHEVYDKLFQDMNRVRIENGYEPVNYLQGYFPHFQENEEGGSILQKFARAAGIEGDVSPLPATINGLTANFKPGIRYMANIQNRLGYATAYDALQGFDRYIEVATDVIFHTADIQRLRALATQIRYRASDEGLKQRIDAIMMNPFLNPDEANEQVTNLTKEGRYGLSNFVDELDEYTNLLAGKKSRLDRGMEKLMGRRFYNVMKKFESRVGANMVAANVGSALTNFIPITQAWSQVSTADVLRGMWDTLKNYKTADGLDAASTFINNRSGYRRLAMSTMDKVSAGAGWMMESIDTFTTGSVVRARYYQNLRRGMSEMSAMQEADQFASGVMADRSKGSTPTLYSARNPLVKLFTQFQLEVNNELSWIFKDMAQEERKKGVAALAKAMFKFLIGAWIYNEFYESIVGRRAALDPLDIINDTVGDFTGYQLPNTVQAAVSGKWDFTKEKPGTYQAIKNLEGNIISEFPGTQALTILGVDEALGLDIDSGRIAVASAIPNLGNIEKALLAKNEDMAPAKKAQTIGNELMKPGLYLATPFGGGQIRKAYQGATAAARGGSYTVDNEGRDILQYPVYNDNAADRAKSWAQALLFGKTATEEAQSWVESGFKSLSAKETAAYQGMTEGGEDQRETYAFIQAARKLEKSYDKMMLLKAYDISDEAKAEYYYQVLAGDTQKAEMEPKSTQERIDYMNEKIQDAQDAKQKQDLKDTVAAGTVTQEKAIQKILANDYAEDENKAYWLYKEWAGGKDYTKYGKILQTIEDGGDLKAAAKEYFDHGAEKGDIGSEITKAYKPQYIAASPEERKKLKEKLLAAYVALGFNRADKSKDIDKWLKDSK
nr:MAG TPA: PolyVal ADP-Ribosyltransferase [Caudoviricetes sp.]